MGVNSDFYYRILNIGGNNIDLVDIINKVISDFMDEYGVGLDSVGLCKVASSVLSEKFKEFGVEETILNTKELFGFYEHEAVLVRNMENDKLNYYLVDLTFKQFLNTGGVLRDFFHEYPADKLMNYGKEELMFCNDLLKYGYSKVDKKLVSSYFSSFSNDDKKINISDLDKFFIENRINKL